MKILIPMAGEGSRFKDEGYTTHKPVIPVTERKTHQKIPMVVAATKDLPGNENSEVIYIDRDFHKAEGVESIIQKYIPNSTFITVNKLTEGQASSCLLAKELINNSEELLIAGCDNGMVLDEEKFNQTKSDCDAIIFTYRNHDLVLVKPEAHGWVKIDSNNNATELSVKVPISNNPLNDHAIVATFWFRKGSDFVTAAEKMIKESDRIGNEFYVDQVMQHCLDLGLKVKVFEIEKYLGWGTPLDYENYENTIRYWKSFKEEMGL